MDRAATLLGTIVIALSTTAVLAQQPPGPAPPEKAQTKGSRTSHETRAAA